MDHELFLCFADIHVDHIRAKSPCRALEQEQNDHMKSTNSVNTGVVIASGAVSAVFCLLAGFELVAIVLCCPCFRALSFFRAPNQGLVFNLSLL